MNGNCSFSALSRYLISWTCFQFVKRMNGNKRNRQFYSLWTNLASNSWSVWMETGPDCRLTPQEFLLPCFQFVKRMNGNRGHCYEMHNRHYSSLASNSWSVWMETQSVHALSELWFRLIFAPCFQFVKRMNGNANFHVSKVYVNHTSLASNSWSVWMETVSPFRGKIVVHRVTCFQFVKRMNGNDSSKKRLACSSQLASNSWSVWMETESN